MDGRGGRAQGRQGQAQRVEPGLGPGHLGTVTPGRRPSWRGVEDGPDLGPWRHEGRLAQDGEGAGPRREWMSTMRAIRPGRGVITTTRSPRKIASAMLWVTKSTVFCCCIQTRWSSRFRLSRVMASRAPNGSSIRRRAGSWTSARHSDTRCCMPPESSWGRLSSKPARPVRRISSSMRAGGGAGSRPRISSWSAMLRTTLRQGSSAGCWNTMPTSGWGAVHRRPVDHAPRPAVGRTSPATSRRSVLFPQPDGPDDRQELGRGHAEVDAAPAPRTTPRPPVERGDADAPRSRMPPPLTAGRTRCVNSLSTGMASGSCLLWTSCSTMVCQSFSDIRPNGSPWCSGWRWTPGTSGAAGRACPASWPAPAAA